MKHPKDICVAILMTLVVTCLSRTALSYMEYYKGQFGNSGILVPVELLKTRLTVDGKEVQVTIITVDTAKPDFKVMSCESHLESPLFWFVENLASTVPGISSPVTKLKIVTIQVPLDNTNSYEREISSPSPRGDGEDISMVNRYKTGVFFEVLPEGMHDRQWSMPDKQTHFYNAPYKHSLWDIFQSKKKTTWSNIKSCETGLFSYIARGKKIRFSTVDNKETGNVQMKVQVGHGADTELYLKLVYEESREEGAGFGDTVREVMTKWGLFTVTGYDKLRKSDGDPDSLSGFDSFDPQFNSSSKSESLVHKSLVGLEDDVEGKGARSDSGFESFGAISSPSKTMSVLDAKGRTSVWFSINGEPPLLAAMTVIERSPLIEKVNFDFITTKREYDFSQFSDYPVSSNQLLFWFYDNQHLVDMSGQEVVLHADLDVAKVSSGVEYSWKFYRSDDFRGFTPRKKTYQYRQHFLSPLYMMTDHQICTGHGGVWTLLQSNAFSVRDVTFEVHPEGMFVKVFIKGNPVGYITKKISGTDTMSIFWTRGSWRKSQVQMIVNNYERSCSAGMCERGSSGSMCPAMTLSRPQCSRIRRTGFYVNRSFSLPRGTSDYRKYTGRDLNSLPGAKVEAPNFRRRASFKGKLVQSAVKGEEAGPVTSFLEKKTTTPQEPGLRALHDNNSEKRVGRGRYSTPRPSADSAKSIFNLCAVRHALPIPSRNSRKTYCVSKYERADYRSKPGSMITMTQGFHSFKKRGQTLPCNSSQTQPDSVPVWGGGSSQPHFGYDSFGDGHIDTPTGELLSEPSPAFWSGYNYGKSMNLK